MSKNRYGDLFHLCQKERSSTNCVLTGATGFLGSNFLLWRLLSGSGKLYALVRADSSEHAYQRTLDSLEVCAKSYNLPVPMKEFEQFVTCIPANIDLPLCDVSQDDVSILQNSQIDEIWHCAASLAYQNKHREKIHRSNVEGTLNVLALTREISAKRYIHVSTAYTAGGLNGEVREQLHSAKHQFNNCYEESKNLGEHTLVEYCKNHGVDWNIIRPSVIVGPYLSKHSGSTDFGYYGFIKEIYRLRKTLEKVEYKITLKGHPSAAMNLVPVDQVVYDMLYLSDHNFGDRNIYHSCGDFDFPVSTLLKEVENICKLDVFDFAKVREREPTPLEVMFDRRTQFYSSYFHTRKTFNRSLPRHQALTLDDVKNYVTNYVTKIRGEEEGEQLERYQLTSFDGLPLCAYTAGSADNPPVVLINACGMPVDFMHPLAKRLAKTHYVLTWDCRWIPSLTHHFVPQDCHSLTFAKDLLSILDHFKIERAPVVGWSSGAQIALRALQSYPKRITSGVLLNSGCSVNDDKIAVSEYESNIRSLLPKIQKSYRAAEMYCDLIYGTNLHKKNEADQSVFTNILTSTDPYLLYMTSMPFRTPEALYRYAHIMNNLLNEQEDAWTDGIKQPVLVYTAENDKVAHKDASVLLAEKLVNSTLQIDSKEGHFAQFYQPEVADTVRDFLVRNRCDESAVVTKKPAQNKSTANLAALV